MINSNCWPARAVWKYDRVELIADGIVHAIGVSLGLVGAIPSRSSFSRGWGARAVEAERPGTASF